MPVNETIVDTISIENLKAVAGQGAILANLATANAVANQQIAQQNATTHQQAMNALLLATVGAMSNMMTSNDPTQAMSDVKILQSSLDQKLAELSAAVAGMQGLVKSAQTIPPVTVPPPAA